MLFLVIHVNGQWSLCPFFNNKKKNKKPSINAKKERVRLGSPLFPPSAFPRAHSRAGERAPVCFDASASARAVIWRCVRVGRETIYFSGGLGFGSGAEFVVEHVNPSRVACDVSGGIGVPRAPSRMCCGLPVISFAAPPFCWWRWCCGCCARNCWALKVQFCFEINYAPSLPHAPVWGVGVAVVLGTTPHRSF